MRFAVDSGLRLLADTPVRTGYLEALAGVTTTSGPFARLEAGWHPLAPLAAFAFGQWTPAASAAGAGVRWSF